MLKTDVIAYSINRAMNTNFYISVNNGEIVVDAPWYLTRQQIQQKVEEKKKWIISKLREVQTDNSKKLINRDIKIWGKECNINLDYKYVKTPTIDVINSNIKIILPKKYKKINQEAVLQILVQKLHEKIIKEEIENIMEKTRLTLGIAPEDYEIEYMGNTLGKCTVDGIIKINPEIVMFDKKVLEYVVLHEFCHLKYKTHAKGLYNLLEKHMPEYKKYERIISNYKY